MKWARTRGGEDMGVAGGLMLYWDSLEPSEPRVPGRMEHGARRGGVVTRFRCLGDVADDLAIRVLALMGEV